MVTGFRPPMLHIPDWITAARARGFGPWMASAWRVTAGVYRGFGPFCPSSPARHHARPWREGSGFRPPDVPPALHSRDIRSRNPLLQQGVACEHPFCSAPGHRRGRRGSLRGRCGRYPDRRQPRAVGKVRHGTTPAAAAGRPPFQALETTAEAGWLVGLCPSASTVGPGPYPALSGFRPLGCGAAAGRLWLGTGCRGFGPRGATSCA